MYKRSVLVVLMLVFSTLFVVVPLVNHSVSATSYASWSYYRQCWVDRTHVGSPLVNFPVLVSIADSDASHCNADGSDIRFTSLNNATVYPYNIEKWVAGSARLVWVRIPRVNSSANTTFWFHYGNSGASGLTNYSQVWTNFNYVLHMNATTNINDFTSNNHDGTSNGAQDTGIVNFGQLFVRSSGQYVTLGDNNDFTYSSGSSDIPFTISMWCKLTASSSGDNFLFGKDAVSNREYSGMYRVSGPYFQIMTLDNAGHYNYMNSGSFTLRSTSFALVTVTYNGNGKASGLNVYANGSLLGHTCYNGTSYTYMHNTGSSLGIGTQIYDATQTFNGDIDEVRCMNNVAENLSWITAEYYSIIAPGTFVQVGHLRPNNNYPVVPDRPLTFDCFSSGSSNQIDITWTKGIVGVSKSVILRRTGSVYPTTVFYSESFATVIYNGTGTSYSDTAVSAGTKYCYVIWSWNDTSPTQYSTSCLFAHDTTGNHSTILNRQTLVNVTGTHESRYNVTTNTWMSWANYSAINIPVVVNMNLNNATGSYINTFISGYHISVYHEDAFYNELPALCQDGDWSTSDDLSDYYWVQYTKPSGFSGGIFRIKDVFGIHDFNISNEMFYYNSSSPYLTFDLHHTSGIFTVSAYGVTDHVGDIAGSMTFWFNYTDSNPVYEEAIIWNITENTNVVNVTANGSLTPLHTSDTKTNCTGTLSYTQNSTGYWVTSTHVGVLTPLHLTQFIPIANNAMVAINSSPLLIIGCVAGMLLMRRRKRKGEKIR